MKSIMALVCLGICALSSAQVKGGGGGGGQNSNPYNPANYQITATVNGFDDGGSYSLVNGVITYAASTHSWGSPWVTPPQFPVSSTEVNVAENISFMSGGNITWTITWIGIPASAAPSSIFVQVSSKASFGGAGGCSGSGYDGLGDEPVQVGTGMVSSGSVYRRLAMNGGVATTFVNPSANVSWGGNGSIVNGAVSASANNATCVIANRGAAVITQYDPTYYKGYVNGVPTALPNPETNTEDMQGTLPNAGSQVLVSTSAVRLRMALQIPFQ